jgi:Flp pilus assembly protein TadG
MTSVGISCDHHLSAPALSAEAGSEHGWSRCRPRTIGRSTRTSSRCLAAVLPPYGPMVTSTRVDLPRRAGRNRRATGQSLVEFALVIPLFFMLLVGIMEFALILNAQMGINFATRDAALIAAEAGNAAGADCAILRTIENGISSPADDDKITQVVVYRSDTVGNMVPALGPMKNTYNRGGSLACPVAGNPSATVSFTLSGAAGYVETSRCNTLSGCGSGRPLDHIGVQLTYAYSWHTPLSGLIGLGGSGVTMVKSNSMRMEPIL